MQAKTIFRSIMVVVAITGLMGCTSTFTFPSSEHTYSVELRHDVRPITQIVKGHGVAGLQSAQRGPMTGRLLVQEGGIPLRDIPVTLRPYVPFGWVVKYYGTTQSGKKFTVVDKYTPPNGDPVSRTITTTFDPLEEHSEDPYFDALANLASHILRAINTSNDTALAALFVPEASVTQQKAESFRVAVQQRYGQLSASSDAVPRARGNTTIMTRDVTDLGYNDPRGFHPIETCVTSTKRDHVVLTIEIPEGRRQTSRVEIKIAEKLE